jgi:hypothetical protein
VPASAPRVHVPAGHANEPAPPGAILRSNPPLPFPLGIFLCEDYPASGSEFGACATRWQGILDRQQVIVYAGNGGLDAPDTGKILAVGRRFGPSGGVTPRIAYCPDATDGGPLEMVSANARTGTLQLVDTSQHRYRYDIRHGSVTCER